MKKGIKKLLILALALCVLFVCGNISAIASEITEAQNKKEDLKQKKSEIEAMIEKLESKKKNTIAYIEELDKQLAKLESEIANLTTRINDTEEVLKKTKIELAEAEKEEEVQYESMKKRIQWTYVNGNQEYLQVLLSAESVADFLNKSEYVNQLSKYDQEMLMKYQKAKQLVINKKNHIETKKAELLQLNKEVNQEKDAVEKLLNSKNSELKKYNNSIQESEEDISEYSEAIQNQESKIEDLLEAERRRIEEEERRKALENKKNQNNSSNIPTSGSGYLWPVPSSSSLTCGFGYRNAPTAGASTYHRGIDIGAPSGSNIVATASGTIVKASYGFASGYFIMMYHGNGVYSYYMHCSSLIAQEGQQVSQGDVIALVGSTGISTGPHLHFAMTVGGEYIDPLNYLN